METKNSKITNKQREKEDEGEETNEETADGCEVEPPFKRKFHDICKFIE